MAAKPSLPGGSSCEPTLNQMRNETVGSFGDGQEDGGGRGMGEAGKGD